MKQQVHSINLWIDQLGNRLTTCWIQMRREISIKLCLNQQSRCVDNLDNQVVNGCVPTWTRTGGDSPELLVTLSVSNGSGLPGFGPGRTRSEGPSPGQEPPSNPTCSVLAGLLPGLDINPRIFGRVEPGPQFHITVPATSLPIKYLSSDHIMTSWICKLCSTM
jgi:hypothetical protein